jgi:hypothetical protein
MDCRIDGKAAGLVMARRCSAGVRYYVPEIMSPGVRASSGSVRGQPGSMVSAQASVGVAAAWPTSGTILSAADATRHGAATRPQPERRRQQPRSAARKCIVTSGVDRSSNRSTCRRGEVLPRCGPPQLFRAEEAREEAEEPRRRRERIQYCVPVILEAKCCRDAARHSCSVRKRREKKQRNRGGGAREFSIVSPEFR